MSLNYKIVRSISISSVNHPFRVVVRASRIRLLAYANDYFDGFRFFVDLGVSARAVRTFDDSILLFFKTFQFNDRRGCARSLSVCHFTFRRLLFRFLCGVLGHALGVACQG